MYHRDHVTRFLSAADVPANESAKIMERAEAIIVEFSSKKEGLFSGGRIDEVIGDAGLVGKFHEMWESGKLHR